MSLTRPWVRAVRKLFGQPPDLKPRVITLSRTQYYDAVERAAQQAGLADLQHQVNLQTEWLHPNTLTVVIGPLRAVRNAEGLPRLTDSADFTFRWVE